MAIWECTGSLPGNANATFQNGRLVSKAQFGRKWSGGKATTA